MADTKSYTEAEHLAVLADRVEKETASLASEKAQLAEEVESLKTELASISEVKDAEIAKITAERDALQEKVDATEREAATAKVGAERVEAAKKATAGKIAESFFTPERATAYGSLDEAAWGVVLESFGAAPANASAGVHEIASSGQQLGSDNKGGDYVPNAQVLGGAF